MMYAKLNKDFYSYNRKGEHHHFIENELYTITEVNRIRRKFDLPGEYITWIDIPTKKTAFFFGARIELK